MKVKHQEKDFVSMEIVLEELIDLPLHYFQTADEMNVIITKRLVEQQIQL